MANSRNDTKPSDVAGSKPAPLPEDSSDEYAAIYSRIAAAVAPEDAVEELWVEDVAELTLEIRRLRHISRRIVAVAKMEALEALIRPVAELKTRRLAKSWSEGNDTEVNEILTRMNLTTEDVTAKAFELRLAPLDKISGLIAQAEVRRNAALREVERRRETLAARLRAAAAIEDAEFQEVGQAPAVAQVRNGRSRN